MQQCSNSNGAALQIHEDFIQRVFGYNDETKAWGGQLRLKPEFQQWLVDQKIKYTVGCNLHGYFVQFESKQEAMLFKLKWC